MKHPSLTVITACFIFISGCTHNAITGKSQLSLFVSESDAETLALTQYNKFLDTNTVVPASNHQAQMVKRVGSRIAKAITDYYSKPGQPSAFADYKWEFNLVESKEINAWCMPGGKVVVYTGLLPVTQNETALAIVLGHEIGHAVLGHGLARLNQAYVNAGIQQLGSAALGGNTKAANIFNAVYVPGTTLAVALPNSRAQEYEADHYGLLFAALAGYDPREAIPFWQRMMKLGSAGSKPPAFLSDHPADEDRITKLQGYMPEALKLYKPNTVK
ncbi:MAG TPA: M48 family metallopeptidase [Chitinophagaceae bacterium]|nr:M48 family metallopeptidase [Chitinophagaceae bacterium]